VIIFLQVRTDAGEKLGGGKHLKQIKQAAWGFSSMFLNDNDSMLSFTKTGCSGQT
jgi:hypothetical protein